MTAKPYLLLDSPREVYAFVCERLESPLNAKGYQAVGVTRRGRLIGGFVFHDMQENRGDVQLSVAGYGAFLSLDVMNFLIWNAFENLACAHVTCRTAEDNTRAVRALEQVGFKIEGRQRDAWDGKRDAILLGLVPHKKTEAK